MRVWKPTARLSPSARRWCSRRRWWEVQIGAFKERQGTTLRIVAADVRGRVVIVVAVAPTKDWPHAVAPSPDYAN